MVEAFIRPGKTWGEKNGIPMIDYSSQQTAMGGHLLDCIIREARIEIDLSSGFYMTLPETPEFRKTDLDIYNKINLDKTEN